MLTKWFFNTSETFSDPAKWARDPQEGPSPQFGKYWSCFQEGVEALLTDVFHLPGAPTGPQFPQTRLGERGKGGQPKLGLSALGRKVTP